MSENLSFLLNGQRIDTQAHPGTLVLDWLRHHQRLTGTKEGCKEGDCGACTVMLGTLEQGAIHYKNVTSCLVPLGELHGKHLVTVEGFNLPAGALNPIQQAMVEHGGSQCGFCTPGFVVSMCWYTLQAQEAQPSLEGFKQSISGNLCRCTGYGAIFRASQNLVEAFSPGGALGEVWGAPDRAQALARRGLLPSWWAQVPAQMQALHQELSHRAPAQEAPAFVIAGGTDLYVQRGEEIPLASVEVLGRRRELDYLERDGDTVRVGALTTFEDFSRHPLIQGMLPGVVEDMELIASLPIRNRATLAGNLINASPIGDMTNYLLALGASVVLRQPQGQERTLPLRDLYLGYKTLAKDKEELVVEIQFPALAPQERFSFEKVSKRRTLDIATVNAAARLEVDEQGRIASASLALGGVAAVPLFLRQTSAWLVGRPMDTDTALEALELLQQEISPISDVRGSAAYKRLLARQLTAAHFYKLYPEQISLERLLGQDQEARP